MQLIKIDSITIGNEVKETVSARELYLFLEVKSRFNDWITSRISTFSFEEDQDFTTHTENLVSGGQQKEYFLTIDMAKELSMVERNDKGKQARQYFIECEKRSKSVSPELQIAHAMLLAGQMIENQKLQIAEMKPKAEFFDAVTESKDAIDIGTVAKVLNMGIGRTRLFEFLRDEKILQQNNSPYQKYIDSGYFRVIESCWQKPDGSSHISFKTVVYQKGVDFIRKQLSSKGGQTCL